jgi:glycosyltransferase involved in cell wall biosynthesis
MSDGNEMIVCVYSFNRGELLAECVRSIEHCAPDWPICVVDDNSDDPETRRILDRIEQRHRVLTVQPSRRFKHGGLYANMQLALETFADEPLLLALQDDVQIVRPIEADDERGWSDFFDQYPGKAFLQPCFLRGLNRDRDRRSFKYDGDHGVYWPSPTGQSAGVHYSDLHLTKPSRLLDAGWQFQGKEPANDRQAARNFGRMAYMHSPIAMWLPHAPVYRGRRKTLALKLAERHQAVGLYPFDYLTEAETRELRQRPGNILPVAEDFLTNPEFSNDRPWIHYSLQGRRWLKKLNSLEVRLRRLFG